MEVSYLSCRTTMELGLIRPCAWLDYLPPRANLLTSTCDQPSKTRTHKPNIHYTKEKPTKVSTFKSDNGRTPQSQNVEISEDNWLVTRKEQIMARFPDVFEGIGKFPGEPYKIQLDTKVPPKQTPVGLFLYISKKPSRLKLTKCSRQVSLNLSKRQCRGLIALYLLKALTNKVSLNSEYV